MCEAGDGDAMVSDRRTARLLLAQTACHHLDRSARWLTEPGTQFGRSARMAACGIWGLGDGLQRLEPQ